MSRLRLVKQNAFEASCVPFDQTHDCVFQAENISFLPSFLPSFLAKTTTNKKDQNLRGTKQGPPHASRGCRKETQKVNDMIHQKQE